jgi:hypothetical protein
LKATKEDLRAAFENELKRYATKDDLFVVRDELRTHFDVVYEGFRDEVRFLHEWAEANHTV